MFDFKADKQKFSGLVWPIIGQSEVLFLSVGKSICKIIIEKPQINDKSFFDVLFMSIIMLASLFREYKQR